MQPIFNIHRLCSLFASGILLFTLSQDICAQTTIISQVFYSLYDGKGYTGMEGIEGFDDWHFDNCYAFHDNYMQIGSGSNPYIPGSVTTPSLGTYGNVILLIKTERINNIAASFRVSVIGDGSVSASDYTVKEGTYYRPSSILIKGCTPSTRIKIESTYGKFYLQTMKIYDIADAVFYESFNYMNSLDEFIISSNAAEANLFDNYDEVSFSSIKQGKGSIFINNSGSYTLPSVNLEDKSALLLTFKSAKYFDGNYSVTLTTTGDTQMGTFNSTGQEDYASSRSISIEGNKWAWKDYYIIITNMNNTADLTISGYDIFLDDIKLAPIPSGLDQSKDNTTYITANAGQERNVTLTRSITPNVWCPLCLPFDVTSSLMRTAMGETCELRTLDHINTSTGIFTFNNINENTTIEAGTPFLVKTTIQVINPTFTGVIISNTPASTISEGNYQFVGNYSPVNLETNGTNLFLGTDGNLYQPDTETGYNRLGGLRAYFVVPEKNNARVTILDEPAETTSIQLSRNVKKQCYYDFQGRKREATHYTPNLRILNGKKIIKK